MSKQGFHWRKIENSPPLLFLRDQIFKKADGPLTGMEIQLAAQKLGTWIANPSTSTDEIGENPGHKTSGGVRFADGEYRYWLIEAPGWAPRWRLIPTWGGKNNKTVIAYKIVRQGSPAFDSRAGNAPDDEEQQDVNIEPRFNSTRDCLGCEKPIIDCSSLWHDEDCKMLWRKKYGIPEPVQESSPVPAQLKFY